MAQARQVSRSSSVTAHDHPTVVMIPGAPVLVWWGAVILVGGGGMNPYAPSVSDAVAIGDMAEAQPITPISDVVLLSDYALVQRVMMTWAGTVNLLDKPKVANVMTVIDGRVVSLSSANVMTLTITVGEALVNL